MKTQPPLTPKQQAEQVSQFDSVFPGMAIVRDAVRACGVTADEALNAHQIVAKKLPAPFVLPESSLHHYLTAPAASLNKQIDDALFAALQKRLSITSPADVQQYSDRLSETGGDDATTYWLDGSKLLTVYALKADMTVDSAGVKVTYSQYIETY